MRVLNFGTGDYPRVEANMVDRSAQRRPFWSRVSQNWRVRILIAIIAAYAASRRSLTAWILVGLLAGAELGHDAPAFAAKLQFLGVIFLRLIKVIIAPLLFGTLVVGIAGHADLKKVGRLGIKSLVYFEIVSTIALLIGCVAINLSRAGEGVRLPPAAASVCSAGVPHRYSGRLP